MDITSADRRFPQDKRLVEADLFGMVVYRCEAEQAATKDSAHRPATTTFAAASEKLCAARQPGVALTHRRTLWTDPTATWRSWADTLDRPCDLFPSLNNEKKQDQ